MMPELPTPFSKDILVNNEATRLEYEVFRGIGEPEVEFVSGMHGQEFGIVNILRTSLNRRIIEGKFIRSHIRIFRAHPEALRARHRMAPAGLI